MVYCIHVNCVWNVMAHTQKPDFVFRRNAPVHLNWRSRQFIRLLAAEVCASAVVMLDTPCSEVVWRVLATHSIRQFPLHFLSRESPCVVTFQLESTSCTLNIRTRCMRAVMKTSREGEIALRKRATVSVTSPTNLSSLSELSLPDQVSESFCVVYCCSSAV